MIGKVFKNVQDENGIKKVLKDYERIVSINTIRASVVNSYVGIVSAYILDIEKLKITISDSKSDINFFFIKSTSFYFTILGKLLLCDLDR